MISSVITSLRVKQLEKKLMKKYGLSEAEAKEILRQGRLERASHNKNHRKGTNASSMGNLQEFCEERLQHRSKVKTSDDPTDDAKRSKEPNFVHFPAIEACCSGTVAWSKSDTESAWESKDSPAKSTDDSMGPPEQIYPLQKYMMHQEDTDQLTQINEDDRSTPCNSDANEELPPAPRMLLSIRSSELMLENETETAETSPVERKLSYTEETDQVKANEPTEGSEIAVKIAIHSNKTPSSTTLMAFLEHPSRKGIPSGPPSLSSTKSKDPVKRSTISSSSFHQKLSHTLQSCATTPLTPSPKGNLQVNPSIHLGDSTKRNEEAPQQQQDEQDESVMTREEEPEGAAEVMAEESAKVNQRAKRRVKQRSNVPRVIFVQDPPEVEVLPFTDEEGFFIKREKRLAPIERFAL